MPAPFGNQNATKLNTPELKAIAYASYCNHLALGKDKKSWCLEDPIELTWETMEKYIRDNPIDFDPLKKQIAEAKGYNRWEQVVEDSAIGKNKDHNTATLQMKMRCKFGWDRVSRQDETDVVSVQHNQHCILEQVAELQRRAAASIVKKETEE